MSAEEQRAANDVLSDGIESWVASLPYRGESGGVGVLGDWIAVVCMVDVDAEGQAVAQYYLAVKGGAMLPHIAEGLLQQGIHELNVNTVGSDE